ncbi:leucine-rich repeat-containing protein 9-like isoform X5 [Dreissena polymorpha]|uniref:leucine-rich repeat-containing protein 9-like isoform X5 n=1 Tax=Dreissena polymorpha TaxID=45954 RepID=UPI002263DD6C|nr:leucine-rich repeat-containing protein 9-like isoform X5 [Dreissena polymorpha]
MSEPSQATPREAGDQASSQGGGGAVMGTHPTARPRNGISKEEEEEIMKEVCVNNGISYNKVSNGGEDSNRVLSLEIFFSGYPKMVGLNMFPNLRTLVIINQSGLQRIEGLNSCPKLTELWVCECAIQKIEQVHYLKHLHKLYLYSNKIRVIENLEALTELEVLWLNQNEILNIENLQGLSKLKQLNLAENKIEKIGHTLDSSQHLEDLNLSGNRISSLKDLTHLMRLPHLKSLSLKDPLYSPAPVSLLCNYATHVLYHLPALTRLDTYEVSSKTMTEVAETTVLKKKMYYNMRIRTVYRNMAQVIEKMQTYQQHLLHFPQERLRALISVLKEMENSDITHEYDQPNVTSNTVNSDNQQMDLQKLSSSPLFTAKLEAVRERVKKWEKKCAEIEWFYEEMVSRFKESASTLVNRMVVELESGGNVRYEEGSPSDLWFTSCHDLVLSRFCASDYREHGIVAIKIRRIIRLHNRILRNRFDEKLTSIVDDPEGEYYISNRSVGYKKLLEYLFWMWDPALSGGTLEPERVLEEGFMDADNYLKLGRDGAVPLSNSLSLADRHRINHLIQKNRGKDTQELCPFKYGQLVISKVYLGKNAKVMDDKMIQQQSYSKLDSVYRPRKMCIRQEKNILNLESAPCECSSRQCEWYIFDRDLVLPEYIVEYEYVTKMHAKSPFAAFNDVLLDNKDSSYPSPPPLEEDKGIDSDVLNMEPQSKQRPRLISLTDELLLKLTMEQELEHIMVLNLHGNGLTRLKPLQPLRSLRRLVVSFNELTRLDELAHMGLEQLDASFNKITTLEGLKGLNKLKMLDLSWNKLTNTKDELSLLRKHTPNVTALDVRNNPWQKAYNLRLRIIGRLKSLSVLNRIPVHESESSSALRVAAGSRISQVSLLTFSRTDQSRPRSLSLLSTSQIMCAMSRNKPERVNDHDTHWYSKITALNLDGQHITKLSNLEKLEHLKYASFNNNDITKIEGLDHCHKLEELSIENNCITKVEGLSKISSLRRLSLGLNYITTIDNSGFQSLVHLHYLALDNNELTTIVGLQNCTPLMELYVGNNRMANIRDVFHLKGLGNLVILDMYGNPVANDNDNYRLFVIYHLRTLKALDGTAIEAAEGNNAKDMFGGRLTPDFVAEKLGHSNFLDVREVDLPSSGIRIVDLGARDVFLNLRSINLEHNNLTSFSGLIYLPNLRVLCLNHNRIECVMPKPKQPSKSKTTLTGNQATLRNGADLFNQDSSLNPVLENLEVLHLGYNCIKDMAALQLSRLTGLKALFLQGNEIQKVEGMEGLHDLRELVLDRNKIKNVCETSFNNQWNLQELHMEENRLRELANFNCLENLQRLYLGSNRIQEVIELENLDGLHNLIEISVVNNPAWSLVKAARRHLHRPLLVYRLKNLMVIDGIPVTEEERAKAELYFMDQQGSLLNSYEPGLAGVVAADGSLPGIGQYKAQVPVKVTNMQLATSPLWNGSIFYDDTSAAQDIAQRVQLLPGGGRRRSKQNGEASNQPAPLGRTNTMYQAGCGGTGGYGGFAYTNSGNRAQFYLNQIPYVATQPSQTAEYVEWLTRYNQNVESRMNNNRNNRK